MSLNYAHLEKIVSSILNGKTLNDLIPSDINLDSIVLEFKNLSERKISYCRPVKDPVLINISGLPASGKTTLSKELLEKKPEQVYIAFDEIMESISFYQKECKKDKEVAFNRWELPARYMGYQFLINCIQKKMSILFEHSNSIPEHIALYDEIIRLGYQVEIKFINASPEMLVDRLSRRERFFPVAGLYERWSQLQGLLPEYQKIVNKFTFIEPWKG